MKALRVQFWPKEALGLVFNHYARLLRLSYACFIHIPEHFTSDVKLQFQDSMIQLLISPFFKERLEVRAGPMVWHLLLWHVMKCNGHHYLCIPCRPLPPREA